MLPAALRRPPSAFPSLLSPSLQQLRPLPPAACRPARSNRLFAPLVTPRLRARPKRRALATLRPAPQSLRRPPLRRADGFEVERTVAAACRRGWLPWLARPTPVFRLRHRHRTPALGRLRGSAGSPCLPRRWAAARGERGAGAPASAQGGWRDRKTVCLFCPIVAFSRDLSVFAGKRKRRPLRPAGRFPRENRRSPLVSPLRAPLPTSGDARRGETRVPPPPATR